MSTMKALPIMKAPSTTLLRAFLQPEVCLCQRRTVTNWAPRKKFTHITSLDKLHRKQKEELRKGRHEAQLRANAMQPPVLTTSTSSSITTEPNQSTPSTTLTASTLPYAIKRTPSQNLPVYETSKSGGSKHITKIQKLTGDLDTLQLHVQQALNLPRSYIDRQGRRKEYVGINRVTQQIVVRGWRGLEIKRWAEMVGF